MEGREPGGLGRHSGFARGWDVVQQGRLAGGSVGLWRVEYAAELEVVRAAAGVLDVFATLSTAAGLRRRGRRSRT